MSLPCVVLAFIVSVGKKVNEAKSSRLPQARQPLRLFLKKPEGSSICVPTPGSVLKLVLPLTPAYLRTPATPTLCPAPYLSNREDSMFHFPHPRLSRDDLMAMWTTSSYWAPRSVGAALGQLTGHPLLQPASDKLGGWHSEQSIDSCGPANPPVRLFGLEKAFRK